MTVLREDMFYISVVKDNNDDIVINLKISHIIQCYIIIRLYLRSTI